MNASTPCSRRRFLRQSAAGLAVPLLLPGTARSSPASRNGKLQHACIGVGGMMGGNDLRAFLAHPDTEVVAICDVDADFLAAAKTLAPAARTYRDWREMIAVEGARIDSVSITVPDHMHAPIAMAAMRAGKHVYCQKPMCHDVGEARALTLMAARAGVVTQLGTQHASGIGDRSAVEWLREGRIGKIRHVVLAANRPGIEEYRFVKPTLQPQPPPPHLDWDLWLGTAPHRDFAPNAYHPAKWRSWIDFGTGWSGDIGCHLFDAVWKALEPGPPLSVEARMDESWRDPAVRAAGNWPLSNHITWQFAATPFTDPAGLQVEWYDGDFFPPEEIRAIHPGNYPAECAMFLGSEGSLLLPHGSGPILYPRETFADLKRPALEPRNHYHHFADACLGKAETACPFARSGPMTEAILLGTIAVRNPEKRLLWDAAELRIPNDTQANDLIHRRYREGWHSDGLGRA